MSEPDRIDRFMTPDGSFRIIIARATEMVRAGVSFARTEAAVTAVFGDLLVGGALLQHAQGPAERFQLELDHEGLAGRMMVDVRGGPTVRGRVERPRPSEAGLDAALVPAFAAPAVVTVSRFPTAAMVRPRAAYRSRAPVQGGRIDTALQQYVLESEQVLSVFSLVTLPEGDGDVSLSGGFVVQALPGWTHEQLAAITECMERLSLSEALAVRGDLLEAARLIFEPLGVKYLGSDPLEYRCRCSLQSAARLMTLLDPDERQNLESGGTETVVCEFCGTSYPVTAADVAALPPPEGAV